MCTAAKVAQHKQKKPELYCPALRCLWRTNGGYCSRHMAEGRVVSCDKSCCSRGVQRELEASRSVRQNPTPTILRTGWVVQSSSRALMASIELNGEHLVGQNDAARHSKSMLYLPERLTWTASKLLPQGDCVGYR